MEFSTKYQLAQLMIERARAAHTPFSWVTADEVYGQAEPLRDYLERETISYVMAVRRTEKVTTHTGASTAEMVIAGPETKWQRMSAGDGTKGPRVSDWSTTQLPSNTNNPRPSVYPRKKKHRRPTDLAYYFCYSNKPATLEETRPRCRQPLDRRRVLSNRQERSRPRPLPGPRLHRLV